MDDSKESSNFLAVTGEYTRSTRGSRKPPGSFSFKSSRWAEEMGFEVLHGIVNCLWVTGEPISVFKEAVERKTGF
jgi:hypothetical protein